MQLFFFITPSLSLDQLAVASQSPTIETENTVIAGEYGDNSFAKTVACGKRFLAANLWKLKIAYFL